MNHLIYLIIVLFFFHNSNCDHSKGKSIQLNGILAAYGDFDSDKFTDIFIINSDKQSFEIQKANDVDHYTFIKQHNLTCNVSSNEEIVGLIPSDFHGSVMMDIIVITKFKNDLFKLKKNLSSKFFNIYLVRGNRNSLDCQSLKNEKILFQSRIQPLLLDYNGDMIGDLLVQEEDMKRYVYLFVNGNFTKISLPGIEPIQSPNSNAFIDLNNDFIPDLFIEREKIYEYFYLNRSFKNDLIFLNKPIYIPKPDFEVVGASTFFDYNSDGTIDHIIPVCKNKECSKSSIVVRNQKTLSYLEISTNFESLSDNKKELCFAKEYHDGKLTIPIKLRHTDVDGDGFIDLIAVMTICENPDEEKFVYILKNNPAYNTSYQRKFETYLLLDLDYKENQKAQVIYSAFLDLGEDGNPDFLIVSKQNNKYIINTVVNNHMIDACFFKVLVISGRCYENCGKSFDNKIKNPFTNTNALGYGTNQAGQCIYFELVDSEGKQRKSCASQMSQTADFALQMPYNIFGLGQLPNFVDLLTASIPINYSEVLDEPNENFKYAKIQSWTQIVPDSQVVVIPHPPNEPQKWRTKLFITPSDNVFTTFITLISICILLGIIVYFLWRKEVLEDRAEHKEYKKHWPESK